MAARRPAGGGGAARGGPARGCALRGGPACGRAAPSRVLRARERLEHADRRGQVAAGELAARGAGRRRLRGLAQRGRGLRAAQHRVALREARQPAVGVRVAVDVAQLHEPAEARVAPEPHDGAVGHGDRRRPILHPQVEAPGARGGPARNDSLAEHRRTPLREAGQRAHEVAGQRGEALRALQHGGDVPAGVVVGEERGAQVGLRAGGLQVAGRCEDRVDRVLRVGAPVAVGVDAVALPRRGHELHPAHGARARDAQVAAVVGLDLVDRRQDLPAHAVLDPGRLVDRQQEDRHAERVDEVARDVGRRLGGHRFEQAGRHGRRPACRHPGRRRRSWPSPWRWSWPSLSPSTSQASAARSGTRRAARPRSRAEAWRRRARAGPPDRSGSSSRGPARVASTAAWRSREARRSAAPWTAWWPDPARRRCPRSWPPRARDPRVPRTAGPW